MASTRSLLILAGVTALLVLAVLWDLARPARDAGPGSRRLVPACDDVARVVWERPAAAPVTLQRVSGRAYEVQVPGGEAEARWPADERVVDDVLGTLELLSPRRALPARRAERGLDPPRLRVHVTCQGGRVTTLALGAHVAAMDRVWLARADRDATDYLVEGHAARALDRTADDLRARRVFAHLAASLAPDGLTGNARIELRQGARALAIAGQPATVQLDAVAPGLQARADMGQVSALLSALRDVAVVRFVADAPGDAASPPGDGKPLDVVIDARDRDGAEAALRVLGACPAAPAGAATAPAGELRLVRTQLGLGCVAAEALAAVAAFLDPPQRMIARALVEPGAWQRLRILQPDGVSLTLQPRGGDAVMTVEYEGHGSEEHVAERAAVDDWLGALATAASGALVPVAELEVAAEPAFSLIVQGPGGAEDLIEVHRDPRAPASASRWLARRNGEPLYLVLDRAPHAAAIAPVEPLRFLPRTLLVREPFALREAVASERGRVSEHLVRGELLDDWQVRAPARAAVRPGVVDALRQTLARLRAVRLVAESPAPAHRLSAPRRRIEAVFDPGPLDPDVPLRHRVDIGAGTAQGCLARLDDRGPVFELDRRACQTLLGPWSAP